MAVTVGAGALVSRRSAKCLHFVSELFQKICGFKALVGREGVNRSCLVLVKIGFDRDYRIALGLDGTPRQNPARTFATYMSFRPT